MGTTGFCHVDKAKSELVAAAGTVTGYDLATSNTVQAPTCIVAQGLVAHDVLQ